MSSLLKMAFFKRLLFWQLVIICPVVGADDSLDRARAMATSCSSCHGNDDTTTTTTTNNNVLPLLSAMTTDEIESALLAYRSGERSGTLMNRLARGYSEAEIKAMAKVLAIK